jgi:hypothetical protein
MEATIRLMASVGPVGEVDIADRFGLSMIEAYRVLNGMVADGHIRARARKPSYWLEHLNARESESVGPTNWPERFSEPFWNYFEALSWVTYRLPEKLHAITAESRRRSVFYGTEHSERLRKEFWREWHLGTIKAFIRGTEVLPAAAVDPRIIEDVDLVFQASTLLAKWPVEPSGISSDFDSRKLLLGTDTTTLENTRKIAIAKRIKEETKDGRPGKDFGKEAVTTYLNKQGDFGGLEALRDTWDAEIVVPTRGKMTHETYEQIVQKAELILRSAGQQY